jgi:hypothetical protein
MRIAALAVGLLMLVNGIWAEEKKEAPALSGTSSKKEGQLKLEFTGKDVMKIHPHGDKAEIAFVCKYTIDKDGLLKAKITELEGKEEIKAKAKDRFPPGFEFQFQWKAKDDAATLDNVDGKDADGLKSHLEGEYARKMD